MERVPKQTQQIEQKNISIFNLCPAQHSKQEKKLKENIETDSCDAVGCTQHDVDSLFKFKLNFKMTRQKQQQTQS